MFYNDYPRKVYAIQHNVTGRIYVGSTKNTTKRYLAHMNDLKKGKHCNRAMQKDFNKYGEDYSLYVLDTIDSYEQRDMEYYWMEKLKTYDPRIGYNKNDPHFRRKNPREIPITKGIPTPNEV